MSLRNNLIAILLGLLLLACGFGAGFGYGQISFEPQVIVKTEYIPVEKRIVEKIYIIETVIEEVEVIREVPLKLKDFESLGELKEFMGDMVLLPAGGQDCDDLALWTMRYGARNGYRLTWHLFKGKTHMANIAYAEKEDAFYGVDFNSKSKRLWWICQRD